MFSKAAHPLALLAVFLLSSCSLKLNDPVTKPLKKVNTGTGCLAQAGDVLDRFAKGTLSETEHDEFYACLDKALSTFALHADGKSKDWFEPEELGNFLTKYFLKGKKISPGLAHQATTLKQAMIGGDSDKITREELRRVIALFGTIKKSTALLLPVMPVRVSSFLAKGYTSDQFEDAVSRFTRAVTLVGDHIQTEQKPYHFDNLAALLKELQVFLYEGTEIPEDHWTHTLLKVSEVIRPTKAIFVSPPRDQITAADWPKIYRLAPRYFASFLRAQFYLKSAFSTFSASNLDRVERFFADFVSIFEFVLEQHPSQQISSAEIDDFLHTLYAQKMLPSRPETAKAFLRALFGRLLGGPAAAADFAITKDSLNRFKNTMRFALEGFHGIAALYRVGEGEPQALTAEQVEKVPNETLLRATRVQSDISLEAIEAVKRSVREVRTVFSGKSFVVRIPLGHEKEPITYSHLLKIHGLRSMNRMLMQAYGSGKETLSESELNRFLDDIFPLLTELGLADSGLRDSIGKRLFEASLFLYASDGKKSLTMPEALELESLILSTMNLAPRIHKAVADTCQVPWPKASKRPIPSACFQKQFLRHSRQFWSYIPGLASFMGSKPAREQEELFATMAKFLRKGKSSTDDYTLSDAQAFVLLPYYIELLFSRFDKNGDGFLENSEADRAYPVFQPFLAQKAGEKGIHDPKTHKAIFNFLLAYRQLPDDDKVGFVLRRYLLGAKEFKVDRGQVVDIFSKLLSL